MSIGLYEKREERIVRSSLSSPTPSASSLTFYRDIAETRCSNNGYERKREESFNRPSGNVKRMRRRTTNSRDDFGGRTTNFGKSGSNSSFPANFARESLRQPWPRTWLNFGLFVRLRVLIGLVRTGNFVTHPSIYFVEL